MNRRPAALTALLAAALLVTSCSSGTTPPGGGATASSPGTAESTPSPAPTTTTASPTPLPAPTQLVAVAPATAEELAANSGRLYCQLGSAEGCHSYAEMQSYLGHVIALVAPMFDQQYGVANRPAFNYVAAGLTGPIACLKDDGTPEQFSSLDYSYCTADRAMYVGQDELWNLYKTVGYAAPAVGYAHEWGHHIQNIMGVPVPETEEQNALLENQADCIAGAWAGFAEKSGELEYPGDLGDLNGVLAAIAVDTPEPGVAPVAPDPAVLQERATAFTNGHNGGLAACNSYFPETPVAK